MAMSFVTKLNYTGKGNVIEFGYISSRFNLDSQQDKHDCLLIQLVPNGLREAPVSVNVVFELFVF